MNLSKKSSKVLSQSELRIVEHELVSLMSWCDRRHLYPTKELIAVDIIV